MPILGSAPASASRRSPGDVCCSDAVEFYYALNVWREAHHTTGGAPVVPNKFLPQRHAWFTFHSAPLRLGGENPFPFWILDSGFCILRGYVRQRHSRNQYRSRQAHPSAEVSL